MRGDNVAPCAPVDLFHGIRTTEGIEPERVIAIPPQERVKATAAVHRVIAFVIAPQYNRIFTGSSVQRVVSHSAHYHIVTRAPDNRVVTPAAIDFGDIYQNRP